MSMIIDRPSDEAGARGREIHAVQGLESSTLGCKNDYEASAEMVLVGAHGGAI